MSTAPQDENKPVKIALNLIKADHALQPRVEMDDEHWNRMARAYVEGEDIPPPIHLFYDGKFYWLVDGFHRYKAMWSLRHMGGKFTHIRAIVHQGTKREAVVYAAQANLDNRSKPMNDLDRKKAMWMLMGDDSWRLKSASFLGSKVGLSGSTSRKYWLEFFAVHDLPVPQQAESENGQLRPTSMRSARHGSPRAITKCKQTGRLTIRFGSKSVRLSKDPESASADAAQLESLAEENLSRYETSQAINWHLTKHLIHSTSVFARGTGVPYPGVYGFAVMGIAVTWDSFRIKADVVKAIGRALCCREMLGVSRAIVLCPEDSGPPEVVALGKRLGVEFMTLEDFVASIKGEQEQAQ